MSRQKLVLPGMAAGIIFLLLFTKLLTGGETAGKPQWINHRAVQSAGTDCKISQEYPASIRQWCELIERYAGENGLDPNLVSAIMLRESAGRPDAYSKSGAVGLLQVMPSDGLAAKFSCPNGPCFSNRPSMQELFDPEYNVAFGTRMLSELIQSTGDVREALKAYGPMDVGYSYADLVLSTYNQFQ